MDYSYTEFSVAPAPGSTHYYYVSLAQEKLNATCDVIIIIIMIISMYFQLTDGAWWTCEYTVPTVLPTFHENSRTKEMNGWTKSGRKKNVLNAELPLTTNHDFSVEIWPLTMMWLCGERDVDSISAIIIGVFAQNISKYTEFLDAFNANM